MVNHFQQAHFPKKTMNIKPHKGFTIIELLVVVSIIGVLSSTLLTYTKTARMVAKDSVRQRDFTSLRNALELYYLDWKQYPTTNPVDLSWRTSNDFPTDWIPNLAPKYISVLPKEPDQNATLCLDTEPPTTGDAFGTSYRYKSNGISYKIHDHCAPLTKGMLDPKNDFWNDKDKAQAQKIKELQELKEKKKEQGEI
jgi:prepilin-type N-terminal cleavage/methylation domain-containing protein